MQIPRFENTLASSLQGLALHRDARILSAAEFQAAEMFGGLNFTFAIMPRRNDDTNVDLSKALHLT